jgi:hypothetical protein
MSGDGLLSTEAFFQQQEFSLTKEPVRLLQFPAQNKSCLSALSSSYNFWEAADQGQPVLFPLVSVDEQYYKI